MNLRKYNLRTTICISVPLRICSPVRNNTLAHCPKDGGFIGESGCSHPNHEHSPLVKYILAAKKAEPIKASYSRKALREGFYITAPNGDRIGFGSRLLAHIDSHHPNDSEKRLERLCFAVEAVRNPDAVERNHREIKGRTTYAKAFADFGIIVIADAEGDVSQAFTFVPNRKGKAR